MNSNKRTLKFIGRELLFFLALAAFVVIAITLGTIIAIIIALIGRWTGVGKDIYIYATLFICIWYAWDAMAWVVGKIADRYERVREQEYFEQKSINHENENS